MKILMLASGGDSVGMNYTLYLLSKKLCFHDLFVCYEGFQGLIDNKIEKMDKTLIKDNRFEGGVVIKSSRSQEFMTTKGFNKAVKNIQENNFDKVIILGGNGSLLGAKKLSKKVNIIFLPATIDNDVVETEYSIGYDSAVENCLVYIDNVRDTFWSFNRTGIFEVMGRYSNAIANKVFLGVNADMLITEENDLEDIVEKVKVLKKAISSPIIIIKERITDVSALAKMLEEETQTEVRSAVIGYFQRGGYPSKKEKKYCKLFVNCLKKHLHENNFAVVLKDKVKTIQL